MLLTEREINIPVVKGKTSLLTYFEEAIREYLPVDGIPIRFAVTQSNSDGYHCELGVLVGLDEISFAQPTSIFDFARRDVENTDKFNV